MTTPQSDGPSEVSPTTDPQALLKLEDDLCALIPEDEVIVHFDVLVETRCGPDARRIRYRRLSPPGSDPLLSLGLMQASLNRLSLRLGLNGEHDHGV